MAEAIESLHLVNAENSTVISRKNNIQTLIGRRPALGEIGNKVDRFAKPSLRNVPIKKSASQKSVALPVASKATTEQIKKKPLPVHPLKSVVSSSSLFSITNANETAAKVPQSHSTAALQAVEDIDADDHSNPLLVSSYTAEIHRYLLDLELQFPIRENFLSNQPEVTPKMRATLVDWLIDVQEEYKLLQETMFLTIQIADRYLQEVSTKKKHLQLVGVGALFLACKYEEIFSLDIEELVFITDKAYTKRDILTMEKMIVNVINFDLGKPLSLHFLRRFSKAAKVTALHHNFSKYFLEWALLEYDLCHMRPSHLAAGALFIAMNICGNGKHTSKEIWTASLEHHSGVDLPAVQTVAVRMAKVVVKAQQSKYAAIGRKYSSSKMMKVSLRPEVTSEALVQLSNGVLP